MPTALPLIQHKAQEDKLLLPVECREKPHRFGIGAVNLIMNPIGIRVILIIVVSNGNR